jgi:hypothetical protein
MTVLALLLARPVAVFAQMEPTTIPKEAHDEALHSLPALRQLVTPGTYKRLGFQSVNEAERAGLEAPMRIFMVRLDHLREYRSEANASELLEDTNTIRYPISVDGQVRTSAVVRKIEGKWQIARFGRPALTQALVGTAQKQPAGAPAAALSLFEVEIPALNLYFVGKKLDSRLMLTPVADDSRFDLKQGEAVDAQQLFAKIAPYAKQMKTGPNVVN